MSNVKVIDNRVYLTGETNTMTLNINTGYTVAPKVLLEKSALPVIEWKIPKPHINYLIDFFKRAAYIYNLYHSEMEIFMLWNTKTKSHTLYIPQQVVSGAHVTFGWELPEDCVLMFELHSHHTMGITFSSTDDTNDSSLDILPHISCVLKNIDKMNFLNFNNNVDVRLSYLGNKIMLKLEDLFVFDVMDMPQITQQIITPATSVYNMGSTDESYFYRSNWYNKNKPSNERDYVYPGKPDTKYNSVPADVEDAFAPPTSHKDILEFVNKQLERKD